MCIVISHGGRDKYLMISINSQIRDGVLESEMGGVEKNVVLSSYNFSHQVRTPDVRSQYTEKKVWALPQ